MNARTLALLVLAGTVVAGAGWWFTGPPPSDPVAERIVHDAAESLGDADAYTYDITGAVTLTRDGRSETEAVAGSGALDATERRVAVRLTRPDERGLYVANRTVYTPCPLAEAVNVEDVWYAATELPGDRSFRAVTEFGTGRILRSGRAYLTGNRTVDGARVHRLTVRPSEKVFRELTSQPIVPGRGPANRGSLHNVTLKLRVDAETDRIRRIRRLERRSVDGVAVRIREVVSYDYGSATVEAPETVSSETACP